ncbi:MAG TPA: winged helix-turn-helix domain-containing protein, partial [Herpetosiphonaceae bacterium]|nr:winged helix-turn-helix domain-containing protein [Herpetosiphonaceae bacterium]
MANQPTILVIQPDAALLALIGRVLKTAGFRVLKASAASEALEIYAAETVSAIVIDQWLPDREALKVCAAIRQSSAVPLLMVGATSDAYTRSVALDQGVDDYVVTPFDESEFQARVRALLRRSQGAVVPARPAAVRCGALEISCAEHRITRHGEPVHLTKTEWALIKVFLEHHGQVLTHRMLLQQVWGKAYSDDRSYLHAYIRRLRAKLEDDPAHPRLISSESGIGYRFVRLEAAPDTQGVPGPPTSGSPAAPVSPAPARPPEGLRRQHLPLTSLIGRDHELAQIEALLASPDARLITLTGTGGAGKTCLAAHLAARQGGVGDGVIFVALDTIHDPERLPAALAWAAGIQDRSDNQPLSQLIGLIGGQRILLVLDNFEQLLAAAPCVSQLLQGCPRLKILVTSRIPLGLYGEQEFSVPPLGLDDPQDSSLERIAALPAIQLFVRRAQAVDPAFALTADNAAAIAAICRRLDRLPLAIELAAVQSKFYPPAAMLQRLSQRLDFLHHAGPDRTPRQHSLRGAIDWSYDLLPEYERTIFAGAAVFEGRFTREAAQALWPDNDPARVERALQALVNASMLQREPSGDGLAWFAMLDTLREYAREKQPAAMADQIACHLLNYYVNLVIQAERSFLVSNHSGWLDRLEREHATIRAVLDWGCRHAVWPAV